MAIKKLSKSAISAIIIIGVLAVAFSVFLPLYLKYNLPNQELYEESKIKIIAYGNEIGVYSLNELLAFEGVEAEDFTAAYDTSISDYQEKTYTGIEVKAVLLALNIDLENARSVNFKGSDGMVKIYSQQDIVNNNNVFIAYKVSGLDFNKGIDPLAYTKETEDGGPYVVIKVSGTYSQNRCKLMVELEVK